MGHGLVSMMLVFSPISSGRDPVTRTPETQHTGTLAVTGEGRRRKQI